MDLRAYLQSGFAREPKFCNQIGNRDKALANHEIGSV